MAAEAELALLEGAADLVEPAKRAAWRSAVEAAPTPSALALCFYAFARRATALLPELTRRAREVRHTEAAARRAMEGEGDAALVSLPTRERREVLWARLPRGPYWPAMAHEPYHPGLRAQVAGRGQRMIRFIGETVVYHLKLTGTTNAATLPFTDAEGRSSVEVIKKGRSLAKSLSVAWQLWEGFQAEAKAQAQAAAAEEEGEESEDEAAGLQPGDALSDLDEGEEEASVDGEETESEEDDGSSVYLPAGASSGASTGGGGGGRNARDIDMTTGRRRRGRPRGGGKEKGGGRKSDEAEGGGGGGGRASRRSRRAS